MYVYEAMRGHTSYAVQLRAHTHTPTRETNLGVLRRRGSYRTPFCHNHVRKIFIFSIVFITAVLYLRRPSSPVNSSGWLLSEWPGIRFRASCCQNNSYNRTSEFVARDAELAKGILSFLQLFYPLTCQHALLRLVPTSAVFLPLLVSTRHTKSP
jgi:hypothetical protein